MPLHVARKSDTRPEGDDLWQSIAGAMEASGAGDDVEALRASMDAEATRRESYRKRAKRKRGGPRPSGVSDEQARAAVDRRITLHGELQKPAPPHSDPADVELAPEDRDAATRGPRNGTSASTLRHMRRALRWKPAKGRDVPLPHAEARAARHAMRSRAAFVRALQVFSRDQRLLLYAAARRSRSGWRPESHLSSERVFVFALMLYTSAQSVDRRGLCREVWGIPREGLAAAMGADRQTGKPLCANSISNMLRALEAVGLLVTMQPNGVSDPRAVEGPSGWSFNIYRWRPRVAVDPVLLYSRGQLATDAPPTMAEVLDAIAGEYDLRGPPCDPHCAA